MTAEILRHFYAEVRANVDQSVPILLKPANHLQESHVAKIPKDVLPRIFSYELFSTNAYVPLNPGTAEGTLRIFRKAEEYSQSQLAWHAGRHSALEQIPAFCMRVGEPVPVYDPSGGSRNWLGLFVVTAPDAHQLRRDCHAILNGLEAGLNSVPTDR